VVTAFISEVYASVQGEGPYTGEAQVFVRLAGCPFRCSYCDTPASLTAKGHPRLSVKEVLRKVKKCAGGKIRTVSVTGGEPLAHVEFLKELFPALKKNRFQIYLETAGIHYKGLSSVVRFCDVIAMDMKLPSAIGRHYWKEHAAFLKMAGRKAFVKAVIDQKTKEREIKEVTRIIRLSPSRPLLVLQPATPIPSRVIAPSVKQISDAYRIAAASLPRVLVMPQQHKHWSAR
jgi:organic radical activating enzyme